MASPLAQQIAHARTLLEALAPTTDASAAPWDRAGVDLPLAGEPSHRRRVFEVRPSADGAVTVGQFGTAYRQVLARFEVAWQLDALHDREVAWQLFAEDTDAVVALMEAPGSRVSANVQRVSHVSARLEPGGNDDVAVAVTTFECLYVHAV